MTATPFNLFSFSGKMKILHLSWIAFFVSFVVWFNLAPMLKAIQDTFGLSKAQISTLLVLNVALTIPCLLYTSPSPRDQRGSRMPSSA